VGVGLTTLGVFAAINWTLTPSAELRWHRLENDALTESRSSARPLLVDFMADWCLPCKEMEVKVFSHPSVAAELHNFVLLKVDLTRADDDPVLGALRLKYAAETLPAVRLVSPGGQVLASVNELPTPAAFLAELARARRPQ
jgi:thiol:disulfide interchange protein DsbD